MDLTDLSTDRIGAGRSYGSDESNESDLIRTGYFNTLPAGQLLPYVFFFLKKERAGEMIMANWQYMVQRLCWSQVGHENLELLIALSLSSSLVVFFCLCVISFLLQSKLQVQIAVQRDDI
jgi:hypothetical protein